MVTRQGQELSVRVVANGSEGPSDAEAFRVSLSLTPEAAIVFTLDGTILKANPAAVKLFEANEDELIGRSIYSLGVMEPEEAQDVVARLSRGTTIRVEMDFLTIKGNRRKLDILDIPLLTRTGEVEQVLGFGRDVTEQRNAEREQALLAALVKTSDDAIISLSTDFRIMSWNQGAQKLLGYTEAEVLGQRPFDLYVPPADRAKAEAVLAADLSSTTESPSMLRPQEASLLRKDGTMVDVTMVACGIWDSAGKLLGLSTILRDVSERKRAANEQLKLATIQDEQASLATIVNASQDAIIGYSKEIKITVWNPAAEKLYGFTAKEAIGHGFDLFVPPEELGPALEADRRVLDTGEAVTFQAATLRFSPMRAPWSASSSRWIPRVSPISANSCARPIRNFGNCTAPLCPIRASPEVGRHDDEKPSLASSRACSKRLRLASI